MLPGVEVEQEASVTNAANTIVASADAGDLLFTDSAPLRTTFVWTERYRSFKPDSEPTADLGLRQMVLVYT